MIRSLVGSVILLVTGLSLPLRADAQTASIVYPAPGVVGADLTRPIQWTSVPDAQAYYLYVGTTLGAKDLVNTGETQQTSRVASNLPAGPTIYARIYTKAGGVWRYTDSTFTAAPLTASVTYPPNGALNADLTQPIQWTAPPNAQAYYLYVGTTLGAKDLVNTGEIQQLSYAIQNVPAGPTIYVRVYTKVGGVWRSTDSTFTAAALTAVVTYPPNGTANADLTQPIQWTSIPNAQAYYLFVGTTPGGKDLVNTGEIQQTSRLVGKLPPGQTIYTRLYTKLGGVWRSTETTFTAAPVTPTLTYPANGAANVDLSQPIQWTTVPYADAYYLWIGRSAGATDLVNSGELHQTSYVVPRMLPSGQTLYAQVFARVGGVWRSTASTFTAAPLVSTLLYPSDGAVNVDQPVPFSWSSIQDADAYFLYVGSSVGAKNLVNSGETQLTAYSVAGLPAGRTLYARLSTKKGGVWRYVDSTFSATPIAPEFLYPLDGATGVDVTRPFMWMGPASADRYRLWVGTARGASDLVDSGAITALTYQATGLPASGTLYATLWAHVNGSWSRRSDVAFTRAASVAPSIVVTPADGELVFNTAAAFKWNGPDLARGYRLTVGSSAGAADLHDSGEIRVNARFVPDLPIGVPLFGRLQTRVGGEWYGTDFQFTVAANGTSSTAQIEAAVSATDAVRQMATTDNRPFGGTPLLAIIAGRRYGAACTDYSATLINALAELNVQTPSRILHVAFNSNRYDVHTLVEMQVPDTNTWMILDPTFALTATRDGAWATAEDLQQATLAFDWTSITYQFLGPADDAYARNYYLDYPLLFNNVFHQGQDSTQGDGNEVLTYLDPVSMPVAGTPGLFAVRCDGGNTDAVINGAAQNQACNGVSGLGRVFRASSVAAPDGSNARFDLFRLRRFVF